jgi:hypothetical protein
VVNIIIVHPWDVVFPRAKDLGKTICLFLSCVFINFIFVFLTSGQDCNSGMQNGYISGQTWHIALVNIIIVHPWDVVFPRAKDLGKTTPLG